MKSPLVGSTNNKKPAGGPVQSALQYDMFKNTSNPHVMKQASLTAKELLNVQEVASSGAEDSVRYIKHRESDIAITSPMDTAEKEKDHEHKTNKVMNKLLNFERNDKTDGKNLNFF